MAELLQKRRKGGAQPPAEVLELPITPSLVFQTMNETKPYPFNLVPFAAGVTAEDIAKMTGTGKRPQPFNGRPQLIQELLPHIHATHYAAAWNSCNGLENSLRWWWRLLDRCEEIAPVRSVADLNAIHYATYRIDPCVQSTASRFFNLVNLARAAQNLPPLYWTAIVKPPQSTDLVSHEDVAKLYTYFQQRCKLLLLRYEEEPERTPTRPELHDLFTLFIIFTGWNPQVAIDIDVSKTRADGSLECITSDTLNPLYSVISSTKTRAGGTVQEAHGLNKQRISVVNIIRSLYRQTAKLRDRARSELALLEEQRLKVEKREIHMPREAADRLLAQMADLRATIRCPWLYEGKKQRVAMLTSGDVSKDQEKTAITKAAKHINAHLPVGAKPVATGIVLTDLRDAFISYRWHKGGYSWLATMLAAGHRNLKSLNHYLNKKQHKQASRHNFLCVTNATWQTIVDMRSSSATLMPSVISARAKNVPEEQIRRWLEGKDETYLGVGCVDRTAPPRTIAPRHKSGAGCRIQRCTLCEHAVLLPDSYVHLAKRLAELRHMQSEMSTLAWVEADYAQEMENTESALTLYSDVDVPKEVARWERAIKAGDHVPMWMEGSYAA